MKKDQIITVVPPTLTETAWVSKTQSSSEYTTAWAMYVGMLLGNVTPENATIIKDALGPILHPDIYQSTMEVLDKQIFQIRQDRVTLSFEPQKCCGIPSTSTASSSQATQSAKAQQVESGDQTGPTRWTFRSRTTSQSLHG